MSELDVGQPVDVDVDRTGRRLAGVGRKEHVAQLRDADVELNVRGVDVAQVLQGHAVGAGVAGQDEARTAHADGHVGWDDLLDLETVAAMAVLTIGVGDLHVVLAVRRPSGRTRR